MEKFLNKLKKNGYSITITLLVLVGFVLLNVFTTMLTDRFFLRLDLTETGIYTLSDRAEEFLQNIDETVDIIVLAEESTWIAHPMFSVISNILNNYSATSGGRIRIQYVNPDLNSFDGPAYNNTLSVLQESYNELENMNRNDIIFLSSRRATLVPIGNVVMQRQHQGGGVETALFADQEFIGALTYVLNEGIARIVFVTNHQESPTESMRVMFERSGFVSQDINLALEEIPEDTAVLVSSAPKIDFLDESIVKLEQFLANGGNVMIMYDFQTQSLPRLDAFLLEWGVTVEQKLVFDEDFTFPQIDIIGVGVVSGALPSTAQAEVTTTQERPMGVFLARPLRSEWVDGSRGSFMQFPLVRTFSASSYAKNLSDGNVATWEREPGDESGPFTLAYNVRFLTHDADNNQIFANLIVTGAAIFDDGFINIFGANFYNLSLLADLANDLNPFGERVFIPPTAVANNVMLVSTASARTLLLLMVIILPLLIIATGVVVWLKRRHK